MNKKWHIEAWLKGGCIVCGGADRGARGKAHDECWQGLGYAREIECMYYIRDAGHDMWSDPRGEQTQAKAPIVSTEPLEFTVSVDMVPLAALKTRDAILTRALAFLVDSNQYEDRAMTAARREQRRELVRDIKAAVKPGK